MVSLQSALQSTNRYTHTNIQTELNTNTHIHAHDHPHPHTQTHTPNVPSFRTIDSVLNSVFPPQSRQSCYCPCCQCARHFQTLYIHYIPLGKYLMLETFVNVCAWLNRIDYWGLSKIHCISKQHYACDILKTSHKTLCSFPLHQGYVIFQGNKACTQQYSKQSW